MTPSSWFAFWTRVARARVKATFTLLESSANSHKRQRRSLPYRHCCIHPILSWAFAGFTEARSCWKFHPDHIHRSHSRRRRRESSRQTIAKNSAQRSVVLPVLALSNSDWGWFSFLTFFHREIYQLNPVQHLLQKYIERCMVAAGDDYSVCETFDCKMPT